MLRALIGTWLTVAATALLGAPAQSQTVTPSNRILVVDAGRTANISVEIGGCKAEWSVENNNPDAFSVSGVPSKPSSKLNLKVSAADGAFPSNGVLTISAGGGDCGKFGFTVEVLVFASMNQKHSTQQLSKLSGERLKFMKSGIKQAESDFKAELKAIQDGLKDGTLDLADFTEETDAGSPILNPFELALLAACYAEQRFHNAVFATYFLAMNLMGLQAHNVLTNYLGLAPLLAYIAPLAFVTGGCGTWDAFHASAFALISVSFAKANQSLKKFNGQVRGQVVKSSADGAAAEGETTVADPGTAGADPIAGTGTSDEHKLFDVNKVKAWNYADDSGNSHGRIRVSGRANTAAVNVRIERVSSGSTTEIIDQSFPVDTDECAFLVFWPPTSQAGSLDPGSYRVTTTDGAGGSIVRTIVVPVR